MRFATPLNSWNNSGSTSRSRIRAPSKEPSSGSYDARVGSTLLRSVYIFDQFRQAVLLLGGDKLGIKKALFYPKIIDQAERIWKQYLQEQKGTS